MLSYKLSQDHLEMFFSAVRSSGGYNNNPSAYNFVKIFKQLLIHANIKGSDKGNCISQDETEILKVPLNVWTQFNDNVAKLIQDKGVIYSVSSDEKTGIEEEYSPETNYSYINNTVGYMAGFIVRSILR